MDNVKITMIPVWVFALLIGIGVILLAAGGVLASNTIKFLARAVNAKGEIVDVVSTIDDDGNQMYQPVVQFSAQDGTEYDFTGSMMTSWQPEVGKQVQVLYDPADPAHAGINSMGGKWLGPIILFALGGVFLIIGVLLLFFLRGKPVAVTDSGVDFMLDD